MPKFPEKPLDEESFRALVVKISASGRINFSEVSIIVAYVKKLEAMAGK